jgi:hypothetical protein
MNPENKINPFQDDTLDVDWGEILKITRRIVNHEIRKNRHADEDKIHELHNEIGKLRTKIYNLEVVNSRLSNSLGWKKGKYTEDGIEENDKSTSEFINSILKTKPEFGWHCSNVWNWGDVSFFSREIDRYVKHQNPGVVARQLFESVRLIQRLNRELESPYRAISSSDIQKATSLTLSGIAPPAIEYNDLNKPQKFPKIGVPE